MQIPNKIKLPAAKVDDPLSKELLSYSFSLSELLNGGLKFSDNFNCQVITKSDTGAANVEFAVPITLKRIPTGYLVIKNSKAGIVYDGATAWTATTIYLKCSVANCNITFIVL